MAEAAPIVIQIDEEALRAQIKRVIQEEARELAMALDRASWAVSPEWRNQIANENESWLRRKWEAEQEAKTDV